MAIVWPYSRGAKQVNNHESNECPNRGGRILQFERARLVQATFEIACSNRGLFFVEDIEVACFGMDEIV